MSAQTAEGGASGEGPRLLLFSSGGERFALDVAYVREIVTAPEVTPVPLAPESVAGVINHRGAIYTLVRFARMAGLGGERAAGALLLRLPEMAVGIIVDAVEGIERLPAGGAPAAEGAAAPKVPFLRPAADSRGRPVQAVDAEILVDTIYRLPERSGGGKA